MIVRNSIAKHLNSVSPLRFLLDFQPPSGNYLIRSGCHRVGRGQLVVRPILRDVMQGATEPSITLNSVRPRGRLRIMTYNVHSCRGTDSKLSVERIAAVISDCSADLVCLQELDVGRIRSG